MKRTVKSIALLLFFIPLSLFADDPFGLVLSMTGDGISVYRDGTRVFYGPEDVTDRPIVLEPNDLIQTENGASLELQLLPGTTRLKLTPFTTVTLEEAGTGLSADLVYGRILADSMTGARILSHGTESTVDPREEAVFGVDHVAERAVGSIPVSLVYALDGTVIVGEEGDLSTTTPVESGTMLRAARVRNESGAVQLVIETDAVDLEIVDYWADNPIQTPAFSRQAISDRYPELRPRLSEWLASGEPAQVTTEPPQVVEPEPEPEAEPDTQPPAISTTPPTQQEVLDQAIPEALRPEIRTVDYTGAKRFLRGVGLSAMSLGLIVEGVGVLLYFAAPQVVPSLDSAIADPLAVGLTIGGGATIGVGLLSYIMSNVLGSSDQ